MISKIYKVASYLLILFLLISCTKEVKKNHIPKNTSTSNEWIRAAAAGMNTALFFELKGSRFYKDTLKSVEADVAEIIQIHETVKDKSGRMVMQEIGPVPVKRGQLVNFKPMGKHIMFIVLKNDLLPGDSVEVKFNFAKSKSIIRKVVVKNFEKPREK